jgi:hypothetical protein
MLKKQTPNFEKKAKVQKNYADPPSGSLPRLEVQSASENTKECNISFQSAPNTVLAARGTIALHPGLYDQIECSRRNIRARLWL